MSYIGKEVIIKSNEYTESQGYVGLKGKIVDQGYSFDFKVQLEKGGITLLNKDEIDIIEEQTLTTGQLIDSLNVGQLAESTDKKYNAKLTSNGILVIYNENGNVGLNAKVLASKWTIPPTYVSFEEAMIALKQGKVIIQHLEDGSKWKYSYDGEFIHTWFIKNSQWESWKECNGKGALCGLEGKWEIEN